MGNAVLFNVTTLVLCVYNLHYDYANNNNRKKGTYFTMCLRD